MAKVEDVEPRHLHNHQLALILKAMKRLRSERGTFDVALVRGALKENGDLETIGGPAYLAELMQLGPLAVNAPSYASSVLENARLREVAYAAEQILREARSGRSASKLKERLQGLFES